VAAIRLEKLNEVQYAYDETRRAELEARGFKVVGRAEKSTEPESFEAADLKAVKETEESAETGDSAGKSGSGKKAARRSKEVREDKDAG